MANPFTLAVILTLANAAKPVIVDDTAYLFFARHLSAHPFDPYGFNLFWYDRPEPAMQILLPPVVPYWLAAGIGLVGENLFLLKMWLFPFAAMLCLSGHFLLRRFARGQVMNGLLLLVLSPYVLPLFNFMLDVPAVALGLTAVALFVHGCDRDRLWMVLVAGAIAGVAAQTKYTMLTTPVVILWYGGLHRRIGWALLAVVIGATLFVAWEGALAYQYGASHFVYHVRDQQMGGTGPVLARIAAWLADKSYLATSLVGHVGGLACVWGLFAARCFCAGRHTVAVAGVVAAFGLLAVALVPSDSAVLLRNPATGSVRLDLPSLVFLTLGYATLGTVTASVVALGFRRRRAAGPMPRSSPASWFLIGWLAVEVGGYFALTPFPAARRVIMPCILIGLIACRHASHIGRLRPTRKPERWITVFGVTCGFGLFATDVRDALPERELAVASSRLIGNRRGHEVWFQGHWGWQYYCDREGMTLIDPGRSTLRPADWLVVPVFPDTRGFYRPYHGGAEFEPDPAAVELTASFEWEDSLAAQTVPTLYGGPIPFRGRSHPRLRVAVYRVTRDWTPAPLGRR